MANNERMWTVPKKRAAKYVDDLRAKKHTMGNKMGQELTSYEAGMRSGYLQAQSDSAGLYKFKKAMAGGKSKAEALAIAKKKK